MQHFHVFGIGIVAGEGVIELHIERDHLAAQTLQHFRGEGARRAIAAGRHHLELARDARALDEILDIAGAEAIDIMIGAALGIGEMTAQHDVAQAPHLVRPEGDGALGAHLHAGPAVVVVGGGDHGDRRHVQIELGEIGHGGEGEADVMDLHPRRHEAGNEGVFDGGGIAPVVVAGDKLGLDAHLAQQGAQAHAQRLYAHQIDFLAEEPPRIIFPKARRLDHGLGFIGVGVGEELRNGLGKHDDLKDARARRATESPLISFALQGETTAEAANFRAYRQQVPNQGRGRSFLRA